MLNLNSIKEESIPSLESLVDTKDRVLSLVCTFDDHKKEIRFSGGYSFIKVTNKKCSYENISKNSWLSFANNSELLTWFNDESFETRKNVDFHTQIITQSHIIDVISNMDPEPQITIIK